MSGGIQQIVKQYQKSTCKSPINYAVKVIGGQKTCWTYFVEFIAVVSMLSKEYQSCEGVPKIWPIQFSGGLEFL